MIPENRNACGAEPPGLRLKSKTDDGRGSVAVAAPGSSHRPSGSWMASSATRPGEAVRRRSIRVRSTGGSGRGCFRPRPNGPSRSNRIRRDVHPEPRTTGANRSRSGPPGHRRPPAPPHVRSCNSRPVPRERTRGGCPGFCGESASKKQLQPASTSGGNVAFKKKTAGVAPCRSEFDLSQRNLADQML